MNIISWPSIKTHIQDSLRPKATRTPRSTRPGHTHGTHEAAYQNTQCFFVRGRTVAGGASHRTPSAFTSYVSGSTGVSSARILPTRAIAQSDVSDVSHVSHVSRPANTTSTTIQALFFSGSSNPHSALQTPHRHIRTKHQSPTHRSSWASRH
jgi:hypothetical protein